MLTRLLTPGLQTFCHIKDSARTLHGLCLKWYDINLNVEGCYPKICWTKFLPYQTIGPSSCVRYHGTKCPLLMALFLFLSFSPPGYFSPRRGYRRVPKFCKWCLESPEMARKLIEIEIDPPDTCADKFPLLLMGRLSGGSSASRHGSEDPHRG
jgi:hypothetical protein